MFYHINFIKFNINGIIEIYNLLYIYIIYKNIVIVDKHNEVIFLIITVVDI